MCLGETYLRIDIKYSRNVAVSVPVDKMFGFNMCRTGRPNPAKYTYLALLILWGMELFLKSIKTSNKPIVTGFPHLLNSRS